MPRYMFDDAAVAVIRARCEGTNVVALLDEQDARDSRPEREKLLELARDNYASDDIEIDDDANLSRAEFGCWVQAWVFLHEDEYAAPEDE